jgi:hypothetical protein
MILFVLHTLLLFSDRYVVTENSEGRRTLGGGGCGGLVNVISLYFLVICLIQIKKTLVRPRD